MQLKVAVNARICALIVTAALLFMPQFLLLLTVLLTKAVRKR